MDEKAELAALRQAFRMMDIDPSKVASFLNEEADYTCKAILFRCVGVNEEALRAAVGEGSNIAGWKAVWDRLRFRPPVGTHS